MFCYDRKVFFRNILQLITNIIKIYLWKTIVDENRLDWKVAADPVSHIPGPVSPESVSIVLYSTALYSKPVAFIILLKFRSLRILDRVD